MADNLGDLLEAHRQPPAGCLLTMLKFCPDKPRSCGIVAADALGVMRAFHEKVRDPLGSCANRAVYAFDAGLVEFLKTVWPLASDFSTDVMPRLVRSINTWHASKALLDIGPTEALTPAHGLINPMKGRPR